MIVFKIIHYLALTLNLVWRVNSQICSQSYDVISGDTCYGIAAMFGVTATAIINANPAINSGCTNLQIGQVLCIPSASSSDNDNRLIAYLGNWQNCPWMRNLPNILI
jgi:spore germination protein YaaH